MASDLPKAIHLPDRGVLRLAGDDLSKFLQGLVTNDVTRVEAGEAVYAALLTPQGKYLFDFFVVPTEGAWLLDCEAARRDDLVKRLSMYRLRAKVEIADVSEEQAVWAIVGGADLPDKPTPLAGGIAYPDPRLPALGHRAILPAGAAPEMEEGAWEDYERRRLALGVPDASRDIEPDRRLILEANFEELHGVDFRKGCYVGQEVTARMKHRGRVRKRLLPVTIDGPLPAPGAPLLLDGKAAGEIRSGLKTEDGARAMAVLRAEDLGRGAFTTESGDAARPEVPEWLAPTLSSAAQ